MFFDDDIRPDANAGMNGDSGTQNTTGTNYGVVFNGTVVADCGVDIKDTSGDGGLLSDNYTGVNGGGENLRPALDDTVISTLLML